MLNRYEKFLEEFDNRINSYFKLHKEFIFCKKGCTDCCEIGEYPFSRLEAEYLMKGYTTLLPETQIKIKNNISKIILLKKNNTDKRFTYCCPFLINKECVLYKYRGIVCRTHGLAYISEDKVILPECVNLGLNYSKLYNPQKHEITLYNPIKENLKIDSIFGSSYAKKYNLECGIIQPLIDWFTSE